MGDKMKRIDDTNITRALVIMLILALVAISIFYIINSAGTTSQTYDPIVPGGAFMGISNINSAAQAYPEGSFISSEDAHKVAKSHFELTLSDGIPVGYYWEDGKVGTPILVKNVYEQPAYWKVPVEYENRIIGYVDVSGGGNVPRFGGYYQNPVNLEDSILRVPEMTPDYVKNMAKNVTANYSNYKIDEPILTYEDIEAHDAWMINVRNSEGVVSRIYITPAHVSETVLQKYHEETTLWQAVEPDEYDIAGINIRFEYATTESGARTILENYDLVANYELRCELPNSPYSYYISVDKDSIPFIKSELLKTNIWSRFQAQDIDVLMKGEYGIIDIHHSILDEYDFLETLDAHDIQLKEYVRCYVDYGHEIHLPAENATRMIAKLEENIQILGVYLDTPVG